MTPIRLHTNKIVLPVLSSVLVFSSFSAYARPSPCEIRAPAEDAALKQKVKSLYDAGVAATKIESWKAARSAFLDAWRLKKHEQIAANLGWAEFKLTMFRDAAEHLHYFLKHTPATTDPAERKRIQDMFDQARKRVGALSISANAETAEVFVDKKPMGCATLLDKVFVEPGKHVVEARLDGYMPATESIEVSAGSPDKTISFKLDKEKADGDKRVVIPAQTSTADEPDKYLIIGGWSAAGASLVAAGVSLGLSAYFQGQIDKKLGPCKTETDIERKKACIDDYNATVGHWIRSTNAARLTGIAGGVLAGVTLAYTYWPRNKASDREKMIMAGVRGGPGGGELRVVVSW